MQQKRILTITSWSYEDALVQLHTLPYLKIIHQLNNDAAIYLVTEEKDFSFFQRYKKPQNRDESSAYIHLLPQKYYRFGLKKIISAAFQFLNLLWVVVSKNITHIHCFCTPAGSTGYLLATLTGRKLVIDSYEPHAESMAENGTWSKNGLAFKILWWLEKKQTKKASHLFAAASGMDEYAKKKYGVDAKNFSIKPCCVNLQQFQFSKEYNCDLRKRLGWESKIVCVYAGKFGGIYLEKEVFDFFKVAYEHWGDQFRILLLTTLTRQQVAGYCNLSNLTESIFHVEQVPFYKMPYYLSAGDFGLTPVKPVPSKRYCSPIKDGEYWAMGLPVIITRNISDDSAIIEQNNIGAVLNELTKEEYLRSVKKIDELLQNDRQELRRQIRTIAVKYRNFDIAKVEYSKIYS